MSDTMMAFLAMMMMMFFSLNQNHAVVEMQREAASVEYEVMANGVAAQTMQYIATKPFDARIADSTVTLENQNVNLLTPPGQFPTDASWDETETGLEYFNQMQPQLAFFPLGASAIDDSSGLGFSVQAAVTYIDAYGEVSETPTWTKEVTLYIEEAVAPGETPYLRRPVVKKRRFSPTWGN